MAKHFNRTPTTQQLVLVFALLIVFPVPCPPAEAKEEPAASHPLPVDDDCDKLIPDDIN